MPRDYRLYLDDILDAVQQIRNYTEELDYTAFLKDRKTQDAVVRNLEVIGEASGNLPKGKPKYREGGLVCFPKEDFTKNKLL